MARPAERRIRRRAAIAALLALAAASPGCVERTIEIRSNPPGAQVYLDGRIAGVTALEAAAEGRPPCGLLVLSFDHYGTREIAVCKDGFLPVREKVSMKPPLYQIFPLDFFFECLFPFTLRDRNEFAWKLEALPVKDRPALEKMERELAGRAEKAREELEAGSE